MRGAQHWSGCREARRGPALAPLGPKSSSSTHIPLNPYKPHAPLPRRYTARAATAPTAARCAPREAAVAGREKRAHTPASEGKNWGRKPPGEGKVGWVGGWWSWWGGGAAGPGVGDAGEAALPPTTPPSPIDLHQPTREALGQAPGQQGGQCVRRPRGAEQGAVCQCRGKQGRVRRCHGNSQAGAGGQGQLRSGTWGGRDGAMQRVRSPARDLSSRPSTAPTQPPPPPPPPRPPTTRPRASRV